MSAILVWHLLCQNLEAATCNVVYPCIMHTMISHWALFLTNAWVIANKHVCCVSVVYSWLCVDKLEQESMNNVYLLYLKDSTSLLLYCDMQVDPHNIFHSEVNPEEKEALLL